MKITFVFDLKKCVVTEINGIVTVETHDDEFNAAMVIEGRAKETTRYTQVKDKGYEIKAGIK